MGSEGRGGRRGGIKRGSSHIEKYGNGIITHTYLPRPHGLLHAHGRQAINDSQEGARFRGNMADRDGPHASMTSQEGARFRGNKAERDGHGHGHGISFS